MAQELIVDRGKIVHAPVHPGVFFARNILPEFLKQRRTVGEVARLLDVSRTNLYRVMAGLSPVTPDMAVRLGKLCGNGPELWLAMQGRYDAWEASHRLASVIAKIPTLR